ncbi:SAM-dependent methyltransferase [Streptomyces spongiicola]|uniref:SAM-dependent methyltransferase n=1 Tax=Streptomyces spongiicola TaxID=1690221 RepID=A0ABM6VC71_9ACTN|nr:N-6 DNA methylase [Streptomyces spongiicola]AWK11594.1 SAM-dependent methyltransferase [Streptomyces spongiicola]
MGNVDGDSPDRLVSGSELARFAGVTRAAVSNWRRRHGDFPLPAGGGVNSPLFSLAEVRAWLDRQNKGHGVSDEVRLWQALRAAYGEESVAAVADVARHLAGAEPAPDLPDDAAGLAGLLAREASAAAVVEGLVARITDAAGRSGSDHVTSRRILRAVRHYGGGLREGATVLDPSCGIGSLLLTMGSAAETKRFGQERDPRRARLAQLRADLAGHTDFVVTAGDSLRADRLPEVRADLVVCDPPVAVAEWGREDLLLDTRWEFGTPPKAEGELAWLQHAYARTAPGGRVLMVMPASVAYRKAGRRIRAELVRRGILTRLIALPAGSAASHALPVHLWELTRPSATGTAPGSVRLVDLTANQPDGPLDPAPHQVAQVPAVELLDDAVDLTPGRYVRAAHRDYRAEYEALRARLEDRLAGLAELLPVLAEGAGTAALEAPTVSVGELARAGLVECGDDDLRSASDQLDDAYLRGFLRSAANTRRSTSASGTYRFDARSGRVPQMDIEAQRRYGRAFTAVDAFDERIRELAELGREAVELARDGLGSGGLLPPADPTG